MPGPVQIKDPQRLEEFRAALGRFRGQLLQALRSADAGVEETSRWLDERRGHWQREAERRERAVAEARRAYDACQSARYDHDEGPPDCSAEARELADAQAKLAKAEAALRMVQSYQRRLRDAAERYRRQASASRQLVEAHSKRAEASLANARAELNAYRRVSVAMTLLSAGVFHSFVNSQYKSVRNQIGSAAVRHARGQEILLVQAVGRGTRDWSKSELKLLKGGQFPKGYHGHHINNVARFPAQAANPDNIRFVTPAEHKGLHQGSYRNNSSGKMFNRKSLMKQWLKA